MIQPEYIYYEEYIYSAQSRQVAFVFYGQTLGTAVDSVAIALAIGWYMRRPKCAKTRLQYIHV
jgi:hypothetical protein